MSWNDTFYWLAILTFALALAQLGIPYVSTYLYTGIFKHEPNEKVREVIRVLPKFLAILSLLMLGLAGVAGYKLITGFGTNLTILIASHWNFLENTTFLTVILIFIWLVLIAIVLLILAFLWRLAARLPDRSQDGLDSQQLHEDLKQLIEIIKQGQKEQIVPKKQQRKR